MREREKHVHVEELHEYEKIKQVKPLEKAHDLALK